MKTPLDGAGRALAVVAHPDDESFGLGAVLSALTRRGTKAVVLCFTHGEASTLHGVDGDPHRIRAAEPAAASTALGLAHTRIAVDRTAKPARSPGTVARPRATRCCGAAWNSSAMPNT
ncbi:hypothetical protein GCM10009733_060150 [Nonomuraea maheshkhaliensis]|uniref:PIG-L family deacetylase n=1 Tax=Nonomuraea maheshkhaliensis TaxID=419590 RepID=A0ABP4RMH2_9ACTN